MLEISLVVTLEKINDASVCDNDDELRTNLHREELCVDVFKRTVKCSLSCQLITQDLIKKNKN